MSATHTPGPWTAYMALGDDDPEDQTLGPYLAISAGDGFAPCGFELRGYISRENATLMAAAPDLLAALEKILPWHDSHPAEATDNPIVNQCRTAIAKAYGKDGSAV